MKRFGKTEDLWGRICSEYTIEKAMRQSLVKHKYPNMRVADYTRAQKKNDRQLGRVQRNCPAYIDN